MGIIFQEGTWISQVFESSSGGDLKMVIALGADLKIPLHDLAVNDLVAGVTFGPEVLRDPQFRPLLFPFLLFLFFLLKPGHFFSRLFYINSVT
jgi:hypothetical protein